MNQTELNKLLNDHEWWVETEGEEGERLILENKNLSDLKFICRDLFGVIFKKVKFINCEFCNSEFIGVDFNKVQFINSSLRYTDFCDSDLIDVDFTEADLARAEFPLCRLPGTKINKDQIKYFSQKQLETMEVIK